MEQQNPTEEEIKHRALLSSIQILLGFPAGKVFIKHLLDSFYFGKIVPVGLYNEQLLDYVGHQRAGVSIYQICMEAQPELTGKLLTEMQKEQERQNVIETQQVETRRSQRP